MLKGNCRMLFPLPPPPQCPTPRHYGKYQQGRLGNSSENANTWVSYYTLALVITRQGHWELYWCEKIPRALVYCNDYCEGHFVVQLIPEIWKQGDRSALKILGAFFGIKGLRYGKGQPILVTKSAEYPVIFNYFTWPNIATFLSDNIVKLYSKWL